MKYILHFMAGLFLLTMVSCSGESGQQQTSEKFVVKRGTNIAHWLSQSDRRGGEREAFFTEADVEMIAELGFDHIRLPVDEEQLWDEEMNRHEDAFLLLHQAMEWCSEHDLRVILDLHIIRAHHFNRGDRPLWTDPEAQEGLLNLWRDLSSEMKQYPNSMLAYEIMNEAVADDPEDWNRLVEKAVAAIREPEPERTIVIGSNRWQSTDTFHQLRIPEKDTNILLSFHFYTPMAFTHHQASWTNIYDYDGPVHYPGEVVPVEELAAFTGDLAEAMEWAAGYYTIDTLRRMMQEPLAFAREKGLPLYCGEFGVYKPAPREDALRWYDDMITIMEDEGIAWSNWCYKGSFGILNEEGEPDRKLMDVFFQNKE